TIMSDSEDSTVTYTTVSSLYEGRSGDALPPPDYVPGPEEPEQAPPSPVYIPYVPKPVYPEYIPPEDNVFPAEEQPLPAAALPTAKSPGYIPETDPNEDLEEDDDEDPEEDPADYPADHDDEEEEEDPSGDDADEEDEEADRPEVTLPPRKRLSIVHCPGYEVGENLRDVAEEEALTTLEGVNTRVTELAAVQEQNTQDIYRVMEDTQGRKTEIF
nr:hypothetical protein [Tanacetum cinerariifolium]